MAGSVSGKAMRKNQPFPFMLLPPELRNQIYAMFLVGPRPISVYLVGRTFYNDIRRSGLQTALLRTSWQCYREGMSMLYGENVFKVYSVDLRGWERDSESMRRASGGSTKTSRNPTLPATALDHITTLTITSSFLYDDAEPQPKVRNFAQIRSKPKSQLNNKLKDAERLLLLFPALRTLRVYYDTSQDSDEYVAVLLSLIHMVPKEVDFELVMSKSALAAANPDVGVWKMMKERKPECLLARKYSRWAVDEILAATDSRRKWHGVMMRDPYPLLEEITERK